MEDQLICGALQTLNEEACEDVLEETEDVKSQPPMLSLPEGEPEKFEEEEIVIARHEKDFLDSEIILLQSSPVSPRWSPVYTTASNWLSNDVVPFIPVDSSSSTPTFSRRKSNEKEPKSSRKKCRPSSLLISKPEDLEQILTLEERKAAHAAIIRSSSVDEGNLRRGEYTNLLMGNGDKCVDVSQSFNSAMPVLTITPAISGSSSDSENENTPLVNEVFKTVPSVSIHSDSVRSNCEVFCSLSCVNEQWPDSETAV